MHGTGHTLMLFLSLKACWRLDYLKLLTAVFFCFFIYCITFSHPANVSRSINLSWVELSWDSSRLIYRFLSCCTRFLGHCRVLGSRDVHPCYMVSRSAGEYLRYKYLDMYLRYVKSIMYLVSRYIFNRYLVSVSMIHLQCILYLFICARYRYIV